MLEELQVPYRVKRIDIGRGEQFDPAFLAISPNNKIPAIVDQERDQAVFESGAILLYLAERFGRFLPEQVEQRSAALQWLFWQVGGLGPMAGQAHHFRAFADEQVPYGIKRYTDEVNRLYGVLNKRLEGRPYVADEYSIADMAIWPWIVPHERQGQRLEDFPNIDAWFQRVAARPAVQSAFELGHEVMMDREGYAFLYGQTAASLDQRGKDEA